MSVSVCVCVLCSGSSIEYVLEICAHVPVYIYIYIYIYTVWFSRSSVRQFVYIYNIYICVCVCVRARVHSRTQNKHLKNGFRLSVRLCVFVSRCLRAMACVSVCDTHTHTHESTILIPDITTSSSY